MPPPRARRKSRRPQTPTALIESQLSPSGEPVIGLYIHVAYQMVDPQWVIEISCLDLISQTTRGAPVNRMVLDYHKNGSSAYHVVTKLPLCRRDCGW